MNKLGLYIFKIAISAGQNNLTELTYMQVQRYGNDPLIHHGPLKARWVSEALSAINEIKQKVAEIILPMLIFHGCDDQLVPFSASEFVFANVSSSNKTFEVHNNGHSKG